MMNSSAEIPLRVLDENSIRRYETGFLRGFQSEIDSLKFLLSW